MKSILLIAEFASPIEYCEYQISAIQKALPGDTARVMHMVKSVGFLIPPVSPVIDEVIARARIPLRQAANWWAYGLSGDTNCQHGPIDPVESWMKDYRPSHMNRQRPPRRSIPLTQTRRIETKPASTTT